MPTPIEHAIADVVQWLDDLDRERDRALRLLSTLQGVCEEPPLLLRRRPARVLPATAAAMAKARIAQEKSAREA